MLTKVAVLSLALLAGASAQTTGQYVSQPLPTQTGYYQQAVTSTVPQYATYAAAPQYTVAAPQYTTYAAAPVQQIPYYQPAPVAAAPVAAAAPSYQQYIDWTGKYCDLFDQTTQKKTRGVIDVDPVTNQFQCDIASPEGLAAAATSAAEATRVTNLAAATARAQAALTQALNDPLTLTRFQTNPPNFAITTAATLTAAQTSLGQANIAAYLATQSANTVVTQDLCTNKQAAVLLPVLLAKCVAANKNWFPLN